MKAGLTTSVILHAALIGFGLFSLSAPRALQVADVEAFPVDIVPLDKLTADPAGRQEGAEEGEAGADPDDKPAIVPDAKKIGDADVDTDKKPTPEAKPQAGRGQGRAGTIARAGAASPTAEPAKEPVKQADAEAGRRAGDRGGADAAAEAGGEARSGRRDDRRRQAGRRDRDQLPDSAPTPQARPQPPQAQTAKAPDHKDTDKPTDKEASQAEIRREASSTPTRSRRCSTRRRLPAAAPSARPTRPRSAATRRPPAAKLTQSEMDALRSQLQRLLEHPGRRRGRGEPARLGASSSSIRPASSKAAAEISPSGGTSGVRRELPKRAVAQCDRSALLQSPSDKYEAWADVDRQFRPERNVLSSPTDRNRRG